MAAAHDQLGNVQAQANALQARLAEINPEGQRPPGAMNGLRDAIQGYIPVLWHPPAAAAAPPGQQGVAAEPQRPQAQPGLFDGRPGWNLNMGNPFMGPGFGNDGAADLLRPIQYGRGPVVYRPPPNIDNNGPRVRLPGEVPQHGNAALRDYEMQMQMLELQNMRRVHDEQLLQTQRINQMQQRHALEHNHMRQTQMAAMQAANRQPNPHYAEYEEEMRRQGFPPGR
jgi:hypothetical protein